MIILVAGDKRAGKDTVAGIISKHSGAQVLAFADPIKRILSKTLNCSLAQLDVFKNQEDAEFGFMVNGTFTKLNTNARGIIQRFGTEAMKSEFGDDIWADLVLTKHVRHRPEAGTVVSDFRFPEEHQTLDNQCEVITIKVLRDKAKHSDTHSSETALKDFKFDYTINNNGTLEELEDRVLEVLQNL